MTATPPLPVIDPDARRRRLTVLLNTAAAARTSPAVYVIEDVHWIDEVSEAMLAEFAAVVPQTRALLLLTSRPEYGGRLNRLPSSHRIAIAPLDDSDSFALAAELLGSDSSVVALIERIADGAAGNPFFAEEIIRDLAERGAVDGEPGAYVFRRAAADLRVPASLQATIAARIDRLNPKAKRTLNAAAVVGARFDADSLIDLVKDVDLAELITAELIDQVTFTGRGEYAFRHPMIRTVAYESHSRQTEHNFIDGSRRRFNRVTPTQPTTTPRSSPNTWRRRTISSWHTSGTCERVRGCNTAMFGRRASAGRVPRRLPTGCPATAKTCSRCASDPEACWR